MWGLQSLFLPCFDGRAGFKWPSAHVCAQIDTCSLGAIHGNVLPMSWGLWFQYSNCDIGNHTFDKAKDDPSPGCLKSCTLKTKKQKSHPRAEEMKEATEYNPAICPTCHSSGWRNMEFLVQVI